MMAKPLLLLIPGMLNDERVWAPVQAALRDAAEVHIADVRSGNSIDEMATSAWALLGHMPASQRLVIVGFSMGGYVALQMLAGPLRRVDALALIATSAGPEEPEGAVMREKTITAIGRDFGRVVDGIITIGTHASYRADAAAVAHLRQIMLDVGADAAVRQNRAIMARADQRGMLRSLSMPCLVMVGDDDRIRPPAMAEEIASLVPHARFEKVSDCGHMLPLEKPQALATALRQLLESSA